MKVCILGVGNILLSDEGFGVKLLHLLESKYTYEPPVKLVDGGTGGLRLLNEIATTENLLVLDTVNAKGKPGELVVYRKKELLSGSLPLKLSPHQIGIQEAISLSELIGGKLKDVRLIGVIPESLEASLELSRPVRQALPRAERLALAVLDEWGIKVKMKESQQTPKPRGGSRVRRRSDEDS